MSRILTVKQISNYISGVFEDELILHDISVSGEIFDFKVSGNNTFIVLKEDDSVLECYRFGKLETFQKGDKVTVRGRIKYYPKGGRVSLSISEIKLAGEGSIHAQFLRLKEKLKEEGLFDNRTPLPIFVRNIAIITSADGAVIHDFFSVIQKEHSYINVEVFNANVQGSLATSDICFAISEINQKASFDIIVVARGGGSYQDLLPFNSEQIARAVFNSKIPIISAVGHETDYTLCDFCSPLRAPTPSIAAELVVKINQSYFQKMSQLLSAAFNRLQHLHSRKQLYVTSLSKKLASKTEAAVTKLQNKLTSKLDEAKRSLEKKLVRTGSDFTIRLTRIRDMTQRLVQDKERELCFSAAKLDALSPLRLMAGGYARVTSDSTLIKSVKEVSINQTLKVAFTDGTITAKVQKIDG